MAVDRNGATIVLNDDLMIVGKVRKIEASDSLIVLGNGRGQAIRVANVELADPDYYQKKIAAIAEDDMLVVNADPEIITFATKAYARSLLAAVDQKAFADLSGSAVTIKHEEGDPVRTVSSTSYVTLFDIDIDANTLPDGKIVGIAKGLLRQNDAAQTMSMRAYLGGTQVWGTSTSLTIAQDGDYYPWQINIELAWRGTTKQHLAIRTAIGTARGSGTASYGHWFERYIDGVAQSRPTKDETMDLTFELKWKFNTSVVDAHIELDNAYWQYVPDKP